MLRPTHGRAPLMPALAFILIEKMGGRLWSKQRDIVHAVFGSRKRVTVVQSCTGAGKSHVAAFIVWAWLLGGPDRRVVTTAPTQRQVLGAVWSEMRVIERWCRANGIDIGGRLAPKAASYIGERGREAIGYSSDSATNFAGWHSKGGTLVLVDDAQGLDDETWDTILGTVTGANDRILALANPLRPSGRFYELCTTAGNDTVNRIVISAFDTPNLKAGRVVIDGTTTLEQVNSIRDIAGEGSALWKTRVLGQFPDADDDLTLVPLSWWNQAATEHALWTPLLEGLVPEAVVMAADLAGLGVDHGITAVAKHYIARDINGISRRVVVIDPLRKHPKFPVENAMGTVGYLIDQFREIKPRSFRVDAGGLGGPIADRLKELRVPVLSLIGGSTEGVDTAKYRNLRAQMGHQLRDAMMPRHGDGGKDERPIVCIARNDRLVHQGTTMRMTFASTGQHLLESKKDWAERVSRQAKNTGGEAARSPDELDAVAMVMCDEPKTTAGTTAAAWMRAYG